jgi:hypothetical protein
MRRRRAMKKGIMGNSIYQFLILSSAILFFILTPCFGLADDTQEINEYIQTIQEGSLAHKIRAAKEITRSGISDTKLFDVVEKELLADFENASGSDSIDYMSWLCKALASSGQSKYKPTIQKIATTTKDSKLKRYAEQSLTLFEEYAARNTIMTKKTGPMAGKDPEIVKIINMLKSDRMDLKRDAAKSITRKSYTDPDLYEVVNEEILKGYMTASDKVSLDAMAWLCKALGTSGNAKYKETLKTVKDSGNPKLAKYAGQGYDMLK